MPEQENSSRKSGEAAGRPKPVSNSRANSPLGMLSSMSPEELLDNLKRIENIVSEVSKMFRK